MRVVRALLDGVEHAGVPCAQVVQAARLDPSWLSDLDRRIERADVYLLCEAALDATGDPAFGLHWAERFPDSAFSPISQLVLQSPNIAHALESLSQFHWLLCDDINFRVHEQDGHVQVQASRLSGASTRIQRLVHETVMIGLLRMLRAYRGEARIDYVTFDYPAPAYAAEYLRIFGSNVRFNQRTTGLSFPQSLLIRADQVIG